MATKKLYGVYGGSSAVPGVLQELATTLADVTSTVFDVSTTSARTSSAESANMRIGANVSVGNFTSHSTTPKPTALITTSGTINFFQSAPLTGKFIAGDWILSLVGRHGTNSVSADTRWWYKIFKGQSAATATSLMSAEAATSTWTTGGANIQTAWDATIAMPEIEMNGDMLFVALALQTLVAESNTNQNRAVVLRQGPDTFIETTDLQPLGKTMIGWIGI